jgi:hypothetical protein
MYQALPLNPTGERVSSLGGQGPRAALASAPRAASEGSGSERLDGDRAGQGCTATVPLEEAAAMCMRRIDMDRWNWPRTAGG